MIKDLISVANKLDKKGLTKEADILDRLLVKVSQLVEEDLSEESLPPETDLISAITTVIDDLKKKDPTPETESQIDLLSQLLEQNL
jgi:hypothetical protein